MGHSHGFNEAAVNPRPAPGTWLGRMDRLLEGLNAALQVPAMLALLAAAAILTYSVLARYFLKVPTDWEDEAAVFLLIGAIFFSSAHVQALRGHVGIEALAGLLPPRVDCLRRLVVDVLTAAFCIFFAWKSWTLWHEAWADGQTTTSTWGPPLWIPYGTMALGMTLLGAQSLLQALTRLARGPR